MSGVLTQLVEELARGAVKVVDLTQPLGPSTPVIGLPPIFAASPGVTIDVISKPIDSPAIRSGRTWRWLLGITLRQPLPRCAGVSAVQAVTAALG